MSVRSVKRSLRALACRTDGAAVMEFGLVAPVFMVLMFGLLDAGHMAYTRSVLNGAVQDAARLAALENADTATTDAKVTDIVHTISPDSTVTFTRKSYFDFANIARPETWNDNNGNGTCDNGEAYVDQNGNGQWDADVGVAGNGGANDVVLYTVTVDYKPLVDMPLLPTYYMNRKLVASAIKKNQPFANQVGYSADARVCS